MRRIGLALLLTSIMSASLPAHASAASIAEQWGTYGPEPFGLTVDPRDGVLYVSNSGSGSPGVMAVIDPTAPRPPPSPLPPDSLMYFASPPTMSVLDPALDRLFVTTADRTLVVVDVTTGATAAALPGIGTLGIALDPASHRVYSSSESGLWATDGASGTLLAQAAAPSGDSWWSVAVDPSRHRVYVTNLNYTSPSVVVFDDRDLSVVARVALPEIPRLALAVDAARGLVYVGGFNTATSFPGGHLYAIDEVSLQITNTLDVGRGATAPVWATLDPATGRLYLSNVGQNSAELVVLDAASFTVAQRVPLPWQPGMNALHPDGRLYVTGYSARLVAAIVLGSAPVIDAVTLEPSEPSTNTRIAAAVSAHDPDADPLLFTFTWRVNGALRRVVSTTSANDSFDLSVAGNGDKGDVISVEIVASDGALSSAPAVASVTVANSAPTLAVSLSDATPSKRTVLVATATAADADADSLTYTYIWRVNAKVKQTTTGTSAPTSSFDLRAVEAEIGDRVTVDVVVSDGVAQAAASASATVTPAGR